MSLLLLAAMAELEFFGIQQQPAAAADNGALDATEEDPAAAFLAQQENEIAGIENDEGYSILESGEVPAALQVPQGHDSGMTGSAPPPLPFPWPAALAEIGTVSGG